MKKYISFDIGGTDIKHSLITEEGEILNKISYKTPNNLDDFINSIADITKTYEIYIEGIALSLPGAVDNNLGIINGCSALPYIHGPNIKKLLIEKTGYPIHMENDANCAALAEVWLGIAKEKSDILFLVIGTGVGGAIIKNGEIHSGDHLHGGEFGYMLSDVVDDKILTLSDTGSIAGLIKRVENKLNLNRGSLSGEDVFKMAEDGNTTAKIEIQYFYKKLAEAIYNLQYSFDPQMIILGGAISNRDDLSHNINVEVQSLLNKLKFAKISPTIVPCHFRGDANLIGAVKYFIQQVLKP